MLELRPYQIEAVNAINEHWNEWQRELLVLPTGCGKTVVFNTIANQRPGQTLILAHREELIEQARDKYNTMFGELPGKIKAQENDIRRVTVGSIQTMMRRDYADMFDTVIIDEAHHAVSPSYQKLLTQMPGAKVLGVTATPDRGDKKSLARYFDGIAYSINGRVAGLEVGVDFDAAGFTDGQSCVFCQCGFRTDAYGHHHCVGFYLSSAGEFDDITANLFYSVLYY